MSRNRSLPSHTEDVKDTAFGRILDLPAVNSGWGSIQKTYTSAKQSHPLIASVFNMYEKGAKTATSLAAWSMRPVVHRLEPQINAANSLACVGLDILEEKIPALYYPPEKIASTLKEAAITRISEAKSHVSNVRNRVSSPVASSSEKAISAASTSYETGRGMATRMTEYIWKSKPVTLSAQGIDVLLSKTQALVDYLLPDTEDKQVDSTSKAQESDVPAEQENSIIWKVGSLASTVIKRSYKQTSNKFQQATHRGVAMVRRILGLYCLNLRTFCMFQHVNRNLQATFFSTVSGTKYLLQSFLKPVGDIRRVTPRQILSGTSDKISLLRDTVWNVNKGLLRNVSSYVPLPGLISKRENKNSNDVDSDVTGFYSSTQKKEDDEGKSTGPTLSKSESHRAAATDKISHEASSTRTTEKGLFTKALGQLPAVRQAIQKGPAFVMEELFEG